MFAGCLMPEVTVRGGIRRMSGLIPSNFITCQRRGHGFKFKFPAQAGLQLESLDSGSVRRREREREKERKFEFYQETMSIRGRPDFWVLDKREGGREKARTGAEEREEEVQD